MQEITIYIKTGSPRCDEALQYFREKGMGVTVINVAENQSALKTMIDKSGQMEVPVIVVAEEDGEEVMAGFDRERLEEYLQFDPRR